MMKYVLYILMAIIVSDLAVAQVDYNIINIYLQRDARLVKAEFLVEDELGRRIGRDPFSNIRYKEIPNAGYGTFGVDSEDPNVPGIIGKDFGMDPAVSGTYSIKIIGVATDTFRLSIYTTRGVGNGVEFHFKGLVGKGSLSTYQLNYNTNPDSAIVAERVVNSTNDLRQDLDLSYKIGWITNQGIYNSLSKKVDNAEKKHEQGQDNAAVNILNAFLNEVNAQRGKKITEDGAVILIEDAEALIEQWQ